jgi:hypothetical protein
MTVSTGNCDIAIIIRRIGLSILDETIVDAVAIQISALRLFDP